MVNWKDILVMLGLVATGGLVLVWLSVCFGVVYHVWQGLTSNVDEDKE